LFLSDFHAGRLTPSFDAVALGYFHHFSKVGSVWVNGMFLSDDEWTKAVLGMGGDCGQLAFEADRGRV